MYIEIHKIEGCVLYFNSQFPGIALEGNGYVDSDTFRQICNYSLPVLAEKKASKLLVDVQEMVNISFADQQWAIRDWVPRLVEAGLASVAIVNSRHYFHRVAVQAIAGTVRDVLNIRYFDEKCAAEDWLQSA